MCHFEKFRETMPNENKFYSWLSAKGNSEKVYQDVLRVWNKFELKIMKEYHDLYLKCDLLLLVDVFLKN